MVEELVNRRPGPCRIAGVPIPHGGSPRTGLLNDIDDRVSYKSWTRVVNKMSRAVHNLTRGVSGQIRQLCLQLGPDHCKRPGSLFRPTGPKDPLHHFSDPDIWVLT